MRFRRSAPRSLIAVITLVTLANNDVLVFERNDLDHLQQTQDLSVIQGTE